MAGPAFLELPIYHGDTFKCVLSVQETINLTGYTPLFQFRKNGALVKDFSSSVTVAGQTITILLPGDPSPNGTGSLPRPTDRNRPDMYDWDLQLTSPGGEVRTILRGQAPVTADISHG